MIMKDVNWGAVILGAAAVVSIVALAPAGAAIAAGLAETGMTASTAAAVTYTGAATTGGVIGNMVSKLLHRAQDAGTTLIGR
jgi:uncharacterized protein with LGFP repeats